LAWAPTPLMGRFSQDVVTFSIPGVGGFSPFLTAGAGGVWRGLLQGGSTPAPARPQLPPFVSFFFFFGFFEQLVPGFGLRLGRFFLFGLEIPGPKASPAPSGYRCSTPKISKPSGPFLFCHVFFFLANFPFGKLLVIASSGWADPLPMPADVVSAETFSTSAPPVLFPSGFFFLFSFSSEEPSHLFATVRFPGLTSGGVRIFPSLEPPSAPFPTIFRLRCLGTLGRGFFPPVLGPSFSLSGSGPLALITPWTLFKWCLGLGRSPGVVVLLVSSPLWTSFPVFLESEFILSLLAGLCRTGLSESLFFFFPSPCPPHIPPCKIRRFFPNRLYDEVCLRVALHGVYFRPHRYSGHLFTPVTEVFPF